MYALDKLWRGEITPQEKYMEKNGEFHRKLETLTHITDQLLGELSPKGQELFQTYGDTQAELQDIENRETFIEGFRLGAMLILDTITEYHGEFHYPSEN